MRHSPLCLAILLLTLAVPVTAQNAVAPRADIATPATDTTPPTAVPQSEIPSRAEASQEKSLRIPFFWMERQLASSTRWT